MHRALTQQRGGCDGGKRRGGEGRGGGRGLQCARKRRGMGTERAAADAGGVCSDGVKGKLVLWNWRGGWRVVGGGAGCGDRALKE